MGRKTINKKCLNCKSNFLARLSEISRGGGKYCSLSCFQEHQKNKRAIERKKLGKKKYAGKYLTEDQIEDRLSRARKWTKEKTETEPGYHYKKKKVRMKKNPELYRNIEKKYTDNHKPELAAYKMYRYWKNKLTQENS